MSDATQTGGRFSYYATRPSTEYDNVVVHADYAKRAYLSFYRFRMLGGRPASKKYPVETGARFNVGVHYVTDHPPARIFNLSVIALLVLFESAANAYFFSLQSEMGLVGGLFQAAAVSLSNVAVSYFIIGFWGLRHASAPFRFHWPKKLWGMFAIAVGASLAFFINLSAAHYRNLLELEAAGLSAPETPGAAPIVPWIAESCQAVLGSDVAQSFAAAAANAMCRPANLHSLDAVVLFALGLAIAALAAFEGRRSDTAFPGLSDSARAFERARADLQDALEDYYDSYPGIVDEIKDHLKADGGDADFTGEDRDALFRALDARVDEHRALLDTHPSQLADEFALPRDIVDDATRRGDDIAGAEPGERA